MTQEQAYQAFEQEHGAGLVKDKECGHYRIADEGLAAGWIDAIEPQQDYTACVWRDRDGTAWVDGSIYSEERHNYSQAHAQERKEETAG